MAEDKENLYATENLKKKIKKNNLQINILDLSLKNVIRIF